MQRLTQIFRRKPATPATSQPAQAPVPLKPEDLKNVAGGLPAVGGLSGNAMTTPTKVGTD